MHESGHLPVLLDEILRLLQPMPGEVAVDCTAGRGGHASAIAHAIGPTGTLVLLDVDQGNLQFAEARVRALPAPPRVIAMRGNFEHVGEVMCAEKLCADIVLADLGFSSNQMDDPSRGLTFSGHGPLDMRLNATTGPTTANLLATITESQLTELIFELGEDPFARRIAKSVLERRGEGRLQTTQDLAEAVLRAYGQRGRESRVHPATRTFMALRIAVNRELESLTNVLSVLGDAVSVAASKPTWICKKARVAFVAFHSLEDRSIKRTFVEWEAQGWATRLTKKPMVAQELEQAENPRSRSAKLRVVRVQSRNEDDPRQGS